MPFVKRGSSYLRVDRNKARGVRGMTHLTGPIEIPPARSDRRPEMVPHRKREREQTGKKRKRADGEKEGEPRASGRRKMRQFQCKSTSNQIVYGFARTSIGKRSRGEKV
jgi:hypothetical protein